MQTKGNSHTNLSKQSLSTNFNCQNLEPLEMSFGVESTLPRDQNLPKCYRRMRPSSVPRIYLADTSNWRDYDLPNYCTTDFRRVPAIFIEQDIISKQRQEIQLLMEELSNRDQELNDLVLSHQKQVNVWECDNEKQKALQAKLSQCQGELKSKEELLKKTLENMAQIKEQSDVDALELKRTHNEMIKLTERIMENSEYMQEMENQNNKLNMSLIDFRNARQAFGIREQELLSCLKEKELQLSEKEQEVEKIAEHNKYLDCRCHDLMERNNNMTDDNVNWKNRFSEMKEEAEQLSDECRVKEENLHKMTQQLHEALQQAIALQKALFISCEREKCKEEVMYSLRKQHKRTMQELQNTRELYDRLSRDTVYNQNIKDKERVDTNKRKKDDVEEEGKSKNDGKHEEEVDQWRQEGRLKMNGNMSFHKSKESEDCEESLLVKEMRERKSQSREDESTAENGEMNTENSLEKGAGGKGDKRMNFSGQTDMVKVIDPEFKNSPKEKQSIHCVSTILNNAQPDLPSSNSCHTMYRTMQVATNNADLFVDEPAFARTGSGRVDFIDSSTNEETTFTQVQSKAFRNTSRNADVIDSASSSTSYFVNIADKDGQSSAASFANFHGAIEGPESSQKYTDHAEKVNPLPEMNSRACDSQASSNASSNVDLSRSNDFFRMEKEKKQTVSKNDAETTATHKQHTQKQTVEFDSKDKHKESYSIEKHSQCIVPDFEVYSPVSSERNCSTAVNSSSTQNSFLQPRLVSENLSESLPQNRVEQRQISSLGESEALPDENHNSYKGYIPEREKYHQFNNGLNNEQQNTNNGYQQFNSRFNHDQQNKVCQNVTTGDDWMNRKILTVDENTLQLWHEPCDQCRAKGRQCCTCPVTQTSFMSHSRATTGTFEIDIPKSGMSYASQNKSITRTPKVSFMEVNSSLEYGSSLEDYKKHQFQDLGKDKQTDNISRIDDPMNEFRGPSFMNKKVNVSIPPFESLHTQSSTSCHTRASCENMPDEVSAYLARQYPIRREEYYNNNNKSDSNEMIFGPESNVLALNEPDIRNQTCSENSQCQKFTFCNKQGFCKNTLENVISSKKNSRLKQDTQRIREEQQKYEIFQNERKGKMFRDRGKMFRDRGKMFRDRDNNNNRMEIIFADRAINLNVNDNTVLNVKGKDNTKIDVKNEDNTTVDVKNKGNTTVDVKDHVSTKLDMNGKDNARLDEKNRDNSRLSFMSKDNIGLNVRKASIGWLDFKNTNNNTSNVNARLNVKDTNYTTSNLKGRDNTRMDVNGKDNATLTIKDIDNDKLEMKGAKNATSNVRDEDNVKLDVLEKDNARFDVNDKDNARLDVNDKDNARFDVNDKDNARLDVNDKDNARFDVNGKKDNARLDVNDKDNARLDVNGKDNVPMNVKGKNNARLDMNGKDNVKLDVVDKDNAILDLNGKDNVTVYVKGKDDSRLDEKNKDKVAMDLKSKDKVALDVKYKDNTTSDVNGKDNTRLDSKSKDNAKVDIKGKEIVRLCTSVQKSSFLEKTVIGSVNRLELRRQFLSIQASKKTETSIEDPAGESYFCPEESDSENYSQIRFLPKNGEKVVSTHFNASVNLSSVFQLSSVRSISLQKHPSQIRHTKKMQPVAQSVQKSKDSERLLGHSSDITQSSHQERSDC